MPFVISEIRRKPHPQGNDSDLASAQPWAGALGFLWTGKRTEKRRAKNWGVIVSELRERALHYEELMQNGRDLFEFRGFIEETICASRGHS